MYWYACNTLWTVLSPCCWHLANVHVRGKGSPHIESARSSWTGTFWNLRWLSFHSQFALTLPASTEHVKAWHHDVIILILQYFKVEWKHCENYGSFLDRSFSTFFPTISLPPNFVVGEGFCSTRGGPWVLLDAWLQFPLTTLQNRWTPAILCWDTVWASCRLVFPAKHFSLICVCDI